LEYTRLGTTGLQVSRICLGTMSFGNSEEWMVEIDKARPIVKRALELGINFYDTANVYSNGRSEEIVGELLKDHRDDVVMATKVRLKVGEGRTARKTSRLGYAQDCRTCSVLVYRYGKRKGADISGIAICADYYRPLSYATCT
jgi:aryl-alcohol dehydrogenase-like predicted oxidoreductase